MYRPSQFNLLRTFSHFVSIAGVVLGTALLITFAMSIGAIIQPNHVTLGLVILNWALVLDAIGIVVVGTFIWFYTLQERNNFNVLFTALSAAQRISIQDQVCSLFAPSQLHTHR